MKKNRLIPVLLLKNGWLVQSKGFKHFQNLGNPFWAVKRLSEWASDELIYLDISRDEQYDLRRDDLGHPSRQSFFEIMEDVAKMSMMPITIGGKVRSLEDIECRLRLGADKVCINTRALEEPGFISAAAKEFGSQCVVISIDAKREADSWRVMADGGKKPTPYSPVQWARLVQEEGAGEIFLNSIDRDGMKSGYDVDLLNSTAGYLRIPVIACGGAGEWEHFSEVFDKTKADAVAAANIFHHIDQSVYLAKKHLYENKYNVRPPDLLLI